MTINNKYSYSRNDCRSRSGIVLLVTMVLLVVLSILGYTLTSRIASKRHRDRFLIDYQIARYSCDSGIKYALATLANVSPQLASRPNEPDFSDVFRLTETEYQQLVAEYADPNALYQNKSSRNKNFDKRTANLNDSNDINSYTADDGNDANILSDRTDYALGMNSSGGSIDSNLMVVRGPYGSPWPFVTEPTELTIGTADVRIEIEDENAKYPLAWLLIDDPNVTREVVAGFRTFCEWMDINDVEMVSLNSQLGEISKIKPYKSAYKPAEVAPLPRARRGRRTRVAPSSGTAATNLPTSVHIADFAKLFHCSLVDTELLARPTIASDTRKESALRYVGMWGSDIVNINTAPRQVLEAAFAFGGDASAIADAIIKERQITPFEKIEDLKKKLFRYSDSIGKCEKYITATSRFFTIRVTAVSGVAKVSAVIAILKNDNNIEKIAVISG